MKVTIISCVYPPEPVTSAITSFDIAQELSKRGHLINVICPFPNRPAGILYKGYSMRWRQTENSNGTRTVHSWSILSRKASFLSRLFENISFGISSNLNLRGEILPEVVYLNTWPLIASGLNINFFFKRKVPIICSIQDIYPESFQGKVAARIIPQRLFLALDRKQLNCCYKVVVPSPYMAELLTRTRKIPENKVCYIPNWVDDKPFVKQYSSGKDFRKALGITPDCFIALFAGSFTMSSGLEMYIKVAELLVNQPNIKLLIVGDGTMKSILEREIREKNLKNIKIISPLRKEDVPMVQASAEILLLSLANDSANYAAPSKQISYMLSGRPILASVNSNSYSAKIIHEAKAGFILTPNDPYAVAEKIKYLVDNKSLLKIMGQNAQRYAMEHFSKRKVIPYIIDIIENAAEI